MMAETPLTAAQTKETQETLIPPEDFIRRLYKDSKKWLTEDMGALEVMRFDRDNISEWGLRIPHISLPTDWLHGRVAGPDKVLPTIPDWEWVSGRGPNMAGLNLELEEALVLGNPDNEYALVLGTRHHKSGLGLSFQYGYRPHDTYDSINGTNRLRHLVNRYANRASGDFAVIPGPVRISVSGWGNSESNGGVQLTDSEGSPLRTEAGFRESMIQIKDTLTRGHRAPDLR